MDAARQRCLSTIGGAAAAAYRLAQVAVAGCTTGATHAHLLSAAKNSDFGQQNRVSASKIADLPDCQFKGCLAPYGTLLCYSACVGSVRQQRNNRVFRPCQAPAKEVHLLIILYILIIILYWPPFFSRTHMRVRAHVATRRAREIKMLCPTKKRPPLKPLKLTRCAH